MTFEEGMDRIVVKMHEIALMYLEAIAKPCAHVVSPTQTDTLIARLEADADGTPV